MLFIRHHLNKKRSLRLVESCNTNNQNTLDLINRQCIVISNEAGGGEQDTKIGMDEWTKVFPHKPETENSSHLSSSSNTSIAKPSFPSSVRANSPTISAFIHEKIEAVPKEYREMDSMEEYRDEGTCSHSGSLSSLCSSVDSPYTVERLKLAGPEFAPFVNLLTSVLEEEEESNDADSKGSEHVHTGYTQTQATNYSQDFW